MKRIFLCSIAIFLILGVCTSCFTTMAVIAASEQSNDNISRKQTVLHLTIIQTLGRNGALAWTNSHDVVKIETVSDTYFDGKRIQGSFTLVGTFRYEANNGQLKTVPVFVLTSEYKKHKGVW